MYRGISLSGSSDSKNNNCAITRLAMPSSTGVPRKTMRSLSSREKISYALSPRPVCSTTIGTNWSYMFDSICSVYLSLYQNNDEFQELIDNFFCNCFFDV